MFLVEQYTIDCEYLAYFLPKKIQKKFKKYFYQRDIIQLFSADVVYNVFLKILTLSGPPKHEKNRL